MRFLLSLLLYWLGHAIYLAVDAVATDWPRSPEWLITALSVPYSRLMQWSGDLDTEQRVWLWPRDDETHEQFEERCYQRWPETRETDSDSV